jgi:hypothetical protein
VVESTALEMRHTRKGIVGSNPSLSANTVKKCAYTGVSAKSFVLFHKWFHKIKSKAVPRRPIDPAECFATGKGRAATAFFGVRRTRCDFAATKPTNGILIDSVYREKCCDVFLREVY